MGTWGMALGRACLVCQGTGLHPQHPGTNNSSSVEFGFKVRISSAPLLLVSAG